MKRILLLVFWCSASLWADAQALLGTTGLLHAPTADMQRDKTFLFGGNYLNTHPLSTHFRSRDPHVPLYRYTTPPARETSLCLCNN